MAKQIKFFIIIIWLSFISVAYYQLFPFQDIIRGLPSIPLLNISGSFLNYIFILLFYTISANGWGKFFWKQHYLTHLEKFVFSTGAGMGMLSLLFLIGNFFSLTSRMFYFIILLIGLGLFLTIVDKVRGKFTSELRHWALFLIIPLFSSLIGALAPPTQYDSLSYHLALPAQYLSAGKIHLVKNNFFFSFPQNLEMLYQGAIALDSDILANLIHWLFLPLTSLAIFLFSRRFWRLKLAVMASLIWLFTPAVLLLSTGTYVDLGLAFFVLLSFYCYTLYNETNQKIWLLSSAFYVGLALGTKYTAATALIILIILIIFHNKEILRNLLNTFDFCVVTLIFFSPWLIKNLVFLNNPIAPWASGIFTNSIITKELAENYFTHIYNHGIYIDSILSLIMIPWNIIAYGFKYGGGFDVLGPIFLLFIPLLVFKRPIDKVEKSILFFILAFTCIWLITGKVLRFLMPIVPFLCMFSAHGLSFIIDNKWTKAIAYFFFTLAIIHNILLFHWIMVPVDPYSIVIGKEERSQYLARKVNYFNSIDNIINNLPPKSKVLSWGETRSYFFERDNITPTVFDYHPLIQWLERSESADDFADTLKNEKVTHLLINEYELKRLGIENKIPDSDKQIWQDFKSCYLTRIFEDKNCKVYKIKSPKGEL